MKKQDENIGKFKQSLNQISVSNFDKISENICNLIIKNINDKTFKQEIAEILHLKTLEQKNYSEL